MNNLAKYLRRYPDLCRTETAEPRFESSGIGRVMQNISEVLCQGCSLYQTCWEREFYQTYRDFFNLVSLTEIKDSLSLMTCRLRLSGGV